MFKLNALDRPRVIKDNYQEYLSKNKDFNKLFDQKRAQRQNNQSRKGNKIII